MADFEKTLSNHATSGMLSMMMCVGDDLKLFDALAKIGSRASPATPKAVADSLKLKPRYVKEWLCCMAAGDIIEMNEAGEGFWIPDEHKPFLCYGSPSMGFQKLVPLFSPILPKVTETFRAEGPLGVPITMYDNFHKVIEDMSRSLLQKHLIADLLPLSGMNDRLKNEKLEVLDVGCGHGYQIFDIAAHFPKPNYVGIDFSEVAITHANQLKAERKLANVTFLQMNAQKLKPEWTGKFDFITNFDACHDQTRPDLSIKETYRALKPNGTFLVIEIDGTGNVYTDKKEFGMTAAFGYAISTFACLQFGSQAEDALCLGTMWGCKKAVDMFHACGFKDVKVIRKPFLSPKIMYICKK